MCGRYKLKKELVDKLPLDDFQEHRIIPKFSLAKSRYNIGPGQKSPILFFAKGELTMEDMLWRQPPLYLARAETVAERPAYAEAFRMRRCLIPMHGFFEWDERTQPKQPWHFHLKGDGLFMVAGLWSIVEGTANFTLITTEPNAVVAQAHHRMPLIIERARWGEWMSLKTAPPTLKGMLGAFPSDDLEGWPVSLRVNNWRNEGPEIIQKYTPPPPAQPELF